jgi:hypothetical protein
MNGVVKEVVVGPALELLECLVNAFSFGGKVGVLHVVVEEVQEVVVLVVFGLLVALASFPNSLQSYIFCSHCTQNWLFVPHFNFF